MQLAAYGSDQLREPGLDGHVDVLEARLEHMVGTGQFVAHPVEAGNDLRALLLSEHAGADQRPCVDLAAGHVDFEQLVIETDGGVEPLHQLRSSAGETPAPGLVRLFARIRRAFLARRHP